MHSRSINAINAMSCRVAMHCHPAKMVLVGAQLPCFCPLLHGSFLLCLDLQDVWPAGILVRMLPSTTPRQATC